MNMKTISKTIGLALLLALFMPQSKAQEILTGFHRNEKAEKPRQTKEDVVLTLPFFDDFSKARLYADTIKWTDRCVMVNNGFPYQAPTYNAATFDVLDENGCVYDYAISNPFVAEYLTSARIRLDSVFEPAPRALTLADSLYLSFYYQPQGNGNAPEVNDSLVLQFGITTEHEEFLYLDYQNFSIGEIMEQMHTDILFPGDTVWAFNGCNPNLFYIITDTLTSIAQGSIAIPCDSVFTTVADTTWYHIWSAPGQDLDSFMAQNDGKAFKQVMIPIRDQKYFKSNFYIRFYNYASIVSSAQPTARSNEDNWNIDVIYLDINRSGDDGSYPMLAFSGQAPTFLGRYRSMPYRQYRSIGTAALAESFHLDVANLDKVPHEAQYHYTVDQVGGTQHYTREVDPVMIMPYQESGFLNCPGNGESPACPYVGQAFAIDYLSDTTSFIIKHYISDNSCNPPLIDSLVHRQGFYNYFAYDDGTPELGYGVEPANGSFAVRFDMATYDTIAGVQILFNHTLKDANNKYFDIVVWRDENGHPGAEITRLSGQRPQWEDFLYEFSYYRFNRPVMLTGTFYIGIVQQSGGIINIGFDASNDNSAYNFYNVNGSWQNSMKSGSLMIRPVVGSSYYIGLDENESQAITLYPNPATSTLNINGIENGISIVIYDMTGRKCYQGTYSNNISVADFSEGLYLIQVATADGHRFTQKFSVAK